MAKLPQRPKSALVHMPEQQCCICPPGITLSAITDAES